MTTSILKAPSTFIKKNFQKTLLIRSYFRKQHNSKPSTTVAPSVLNKVNVLGVLGITSALVASYLLVNSQGDEQVKPPRRESSKQLPVLNNLIANPESYIPRKAKDEDLRKQYNFIKKVVNDCAGAVFYLELRDPNIKDPETGKAIITSNGSGFIISEDGWALTNAHVVLNKPQSTITAVMRDGRSYSVKVEDADMNIDLALLKLETNDKLPSLEFGDTGDASVGEWVVALGSPLSLSNSVTVGIISSVDRPAEELGLKNYSMTYIQTDASITFGNSGGPLVNLDGNVIGINNLRLTSGISFAIPVEYAKKFVENSKLRLQNITTRKVDKVLFGLTTISISPELLLEMSTENYNIAKDISHGLLVWKIIPGTPAYKCGLQVGDIITHVNGIPVKKPTELYNFSGSKNVLEIVVINNGKKKSVLLHPN
ncbi:hypothetical protein ABEB36_000545 [Hypothenemus hampei]|uniref:Serine protease HTRA2, mitochondrial n=1 Tax=Hypothenemus hampei TaxID=57062 RepID=A0ABD1FC69_HYPHA